MTSSWPWMKGATSHLNDPIDPVNDLDVRPAVKDLLAKHRSNIEEVKEGLAKETLYSAVKHDDLWILRFLMSHKGSVKKALEAAKGSLAFRQEQDFCAKDIRFTTLDKEHCECDAFKRYSVYCKEDFAQSCVPDGRLGVIIFLRFASIDEHGLEKNVDEKDWLPTFAYINEWCFQWCDYVTRTTGRLTKLIRVVDLHSVTMSDWNKEVTKRDTNAMNHMEDFYPQLLQVIFLCNAPKWIQIPWRIFKLIMPKRILDKFDVIKPKSNEKERQRLAPYVSMENLPERFGGDYQPWPIEYKLPGAS